MKTPHARIHSLQEERLDIRDTAELLLKKIREATTNPDWSDYLKLELSRMAVIVVNFKEDFVEDSLEFITSFRERMSHESDNQAS